MVLHKKVVKFIGLQYYLLAYSGFCFLAFRGNNFAA